MKNIKLPKGYEWNKPSLHALIENEETYLNAVCKAHEGSPVYSIVIKNIPDNLIRYGLNEGKQIAYDTFEVKLDLLPWMVDSAEYCECCGQKQGASTISQKLKDLLTTEDCSRGIDWNISCNGAEAPDTIYVNLHTNSIDAINKFESNA